MDAKENVDDSESIASDESDEMTEVDEDDVDFLRASYLSEMKELEAQFSRLKEDLINEKQTVIDQKLKELDDETAEEFTIPVQKLQQNMEMKINLATLMRDYRIKNVDHTFDYEGKSNSQSLQNDKLLLYDTQVARIEHEIRQLEESRRQYIFDYNLYHLSQHETQVTFDLAENNSPQINNSEPADSTSATNESEAAISTRRSKKAAAVKKQQSSLLSLPPPLPLLHQSLSPPPGPYIVYSLHEYDILEDCSIIQMHLDRNSIQNNVSTSVL